MKKIKLLVLLLLSMVMVFTGCSNGAGNDGDLTIVSTVPSVTEILFELGCGEQIIGVDAYSNYPAETEGIEKVGDFNGFDVEKVVSLNPSVVFAGNLLQEDQINQLEDLGVNVYSVEPTYYEDIATSITTIGEAVGKSRDAKKLVKVLDEDMQEVKEKGEALAENPTVYYVMSIGEFGNWTSGEGSFINSVMEFAGGDCITKNSGVEWMDYPLEDLLKADPDVLIVSQYVNMDELKADPVYSELSAVKNDSIITINPDLIERPGPRIVEAAQTIYDGLSK